ncbi:MAG: tetratricopeptide repeat protein [Lysobacterales bacterium]
MPDGSGFLAELKRRHVWRVAIAYVVTAWVLLQLASVMLPSFGAPGWVMRVLFGILVILFPIALILAWAFEITPEGVRRTEPSGSPEAREARDTRAIGRKLNTGIIVALVIAVALLAGNQFIWHKGLHGAAAPARPGNSADGATEARATSKLDAPKPLAPATPAKSVAVLPFENLSSDKQNDYFVSGMQDLILTKLADIGDLKVISRTSTLQYGSHPQNLKTVGQQLGVATLMEGSVQKQGNQVLINVQLINAATDAHIWAQSYTRTLDNVFGVEGEVAERIATALNARLSPAQSAQLAAAPTTNKAAYDAFLRAEYQGNKGQINYDTASMKAAMPLYRQAVEQDPKFALAWARLSYEESQLAWFGGGGEDIGKLRQQARADVERALQLQPDLAVAQLALGYSDYWGHGDYPAALQAFAAALALKPNDSDALAAQGYVERRQGRIDDSIASLQKAFALDPRNSALAYEVGSTCMMVSRYPEAQDWLQRALAIDPDNRNAKVYYANAIAHSTGDIPRALAAMQGDDPVLKLGRITLLGYQRKFDEALALLASVPDTPDNFPPALNGPKVEQQASLYRLMGDEARARPLFAQSLPVLRAQLKMFSGIDLAAQWQLVGHAEIGSGQTAAGLDAIAKSLKILSGNPDQVYGPQIMVTAAFYYAQARRPDLAVPLLAKALATPGIGVLYSPVLLWLDPQWDPIRTDPDFEALLRKYASDKPAVIPAIPAAGSASSG